MLLSIAMMVKNEEKHLRECLESVQPILKNIDSELIIIDTGSEDSTVNIAKDFTNKVYFHQWNNDFSYMRNISIAYSKGQWILILDGDEFIENCHPIIDFLKSENSENYNSAMITCISFMKSYSKEDTVSLDSIRLFRNDGTLKYEGAIHNQAIYKKPTAKLSCTLYHYGYVSDDKDLMEKKYKRTTFILKRELRKDPGNIYYRYQLSSSYSMYKEDEKALSEIKKAYNLCKNIDKNTLRFVYMTYAKCLFALGMFWEIEKICLEGISISKNDTLDKIDLYYYMGRGYQGVGNYKAALKSYEKYIYLMDKYHKDLLPLDPSIINNTLAFEDRVYEDMISIYYNNENYVRVREILLNIKDNSLLLKMGNTIVDTYVKLGDDDLLLNYYNEVVSHCDDIYIEDRFFYFLELKKMDAPNNINNKIEKKFKDCANERYSMLNHIRNVENNDNKAKKIEVFVDKYNGEEISPYNGDILKFAIEMDMNIPYLVKNLSLSAISAMFDYCLLKYNDFNYMMESYFRNTYEVAINSPDKINDDSLFYKRRFYNVLLRYILKSHENLPNINDEYFCEYMHNGIELIKIIYSPYILEKEMSSEMKNYEERFFMYLLKAENFKGTPQYDCYMQHSLNIYPMIQNL